MLLGDLLGLRCLGPVLPDRFLPLLQLSLPRMLRLLLQHLPLLFDLPFRRYLPRLSLRLTLGRISILGLLAFLGLLLQLLRPSRLLPLCLVLWSLCLL